jgi:hypothetical protein
MSVSRVVFMMDRQFSQMAFIVLCPIHIKNSIPYFFGGIAGDAEAGLASCGAA